MPEGRAAQSQSLPRPPANLDSASLHPGYALLLNEPTNGLEAATETRLIAHLAALPQAMVIVSHDRRLLERLAIRGVSLHDGRLAAATLAPAWARPRARASACTLGDERSRPCGAGTGA